MPVNILPVSTIYWEIRSPSKYIEKKGGEVLRQESMLVKSCSAFPE